MRPRATSIKLLELLSQMLPLNEADYKLRLEVARLRELNGDQRGAADALDQAMYINPFDIAVHQHLAELLHATGDRTKAIRERQAVVALNLGIAPKRCTSSRSRTMKPVTKLMRA